MISTQMQSTNAIAQESKMKVDNLFSEIEKLKEELKKVPDD
jgi:chaperonin cofactor prefoldin